MLNNASLEQLIKIANELDSRGFLKESDEVDALIKEAFVCMGICVIMAAVVAAGLVGTAAHKASASAMTIFKEMGITDLPVVPAPDLWEAFRNTLSETDLIDGAGSFPAGHPKGGTFVRKVFDVRVERMIEGDFDVKMDEDYFEEKFEEFYGESAKGIFQYGLDNEEGWVDAWNMIVDIFEEQWHAAKEVDKKKEDGMSEEDAVAAVAGGGAAAAGAAAAGAAGAPPPVPGGGAFYYHGPSGQAQLSAEEIAGKVSENRSARHLVWAAGWPGWKKWTEVPEVSDLVSGGAAAAPPPPPPPSAPAAAGPAPDFSAPGAAAAEPEKPEYGSMEEAFSGRGGDDDSDEALTSHNLRYDKDKDEWVEA